MIVKKNNINEMGSLSLELAFILPVIILLLVGSIFLGIGFTNKSAVTDASYIGAKSISEYGGDKTEVREDILITLQSRFMGNLDNVEVTISYLSNDGVTTYSKTASATDTEVITSVWAFPGERMFVQIDAKNYDLNIPFFETDLINLSGKSFSRNFNTGP